MALSTTPSFFRSLTVEQLTGRDESHLVTLSDGHQQLQRPVAEALAALQADAAAAGFDLAVASGFRSYARQLVIFNGKACGERPVHDDAGAPIVMECLSPIERLHAILRFSALPGASRHHWGTDLDVFDAAALGPGESVSLSPAEVAPGGVFDAMHRWLDERMAAGESYGFFRPYGVDRGGVAPERWHLSYQPMARLCEQQLTPALLRECWSETCGGLEESVAGDRPKALALHELIETHLDVLYSRYVAVPNEGWAPVG